ncbi:glycosyltransferase family 10 domain-containing protein [Flavobacterium sp. 120]|uniref:glycosyltransferase family 10 domain-containing protein n=1 Tax=Flavobacterium sp. 120 TaxID=2135626 RepID=UPI000EAFB608|nr:glycosyltransferase family 10 [Flavobacterium sp. 120]RKS13349.1 glycosyl transferase family 10 (putative fucosyltransferase) [Flavobacterium sp. 120]
MKEIKINFVDFWPSFNKTNNYFYNLLVKKYIVLIDEKPDFLFYSCFGEEYLKFDCFRIFYTGENRRPDFSVCDYAFSFDYNNRKNHFRLPLYSLYIDHCDMLDQLQTIVNREEARRIWRTKSKFCCMVISNPNCIERIEFFKNLSKVKLIDSGGAVLNNVGGRVADKFDFIKDYKFVISFENKEQDGYTTEKIMEPIFKDCIPIYWGNRLIDKDFNAKRFIDYNKFKSEKDLIDEMLKIDQNEELAIDIIMQPTFSLDKLSHEEEHQEVLRILIKIIENHENLFVRKLWRYILRYNIGYKKHKKRFLVKLKLV